ncbi:ferredoxin [Kitasatospora sp. NPDC008115]|uniref:ferredoxin n=1 Tax=Kitasatospora sp. NPDC008115 TaxID=3364022 RepID=UPI0036EEC11C
MQVNVERDRCCSSGQCVMTAPEVFEQDDRDGLVTLRRSVVPAELSADVRLAADLCPGGAIAVTGDDRPGTAG